MSVFHRQGKTTILDAITQGQTFRLHLMAPSPPLADDAMIYDMTPAVFDGYGPKSFTFPPSTLNADGNAVTVANAQTFTATPGGAGGQVGGYYVTEHPSGDLIYFERWEGTYTVVYTNAPLTIKPRLLLSKCNP